MGGQVILDLIGSSVVFSLLLLMGIRMNATSSESMQAYRGDVLVQQNIVEVVSLLEYDFRKIGYCKDPTKIETNKAIIYADSIKIKYLTDVDNDGNVDTMSYYVGPTSELTVTPNPRDRNLYRVINNATPIGVNLGVTRFELHYFNVDKDPITYPISNYGEIYTMQIDVQCENLFASSVTQYAGTMDSLNNQYQSAYWRQVRLVARNLRNR